MTTTLVRPASARTDAGRYRPDIDGLRAVAVSAVVAYHAFPTWAPGGFVGVDVFFVISGFLITRIVAGQKGEGRFRFRAFYARRARRILPAYFAMTIAVGLAAQAILLPIGLGHFGAALAGSNLFLTNLIFAQTGLYFEPASRDSALLHLWSLAVEEQFYLVWPLLIVAVSLGPLRRLRPALLVALAAASLAFAEWQIGRGAAREAFYFLPGRVWEFLLGGLLAVAPLAPPGTRLAANAASIAGYALIAASLVLLNDGSRFPGLGALPACLGAAALIWGGSGEAPAAAAPLRSRPFVALGRISYSLYLWHWPPLAFAKLILVQPLPPALAAALVALAVGIAALSWRYVEQPWRRRELRWRHAALAVAIGLGLIALGAADFVGKGLPGRIPAGLTLEDTDINPLRARCFLGWTPQTAPPAGCIAGDPAAPGEALVWGDSHADALMPGVAAWAQGRRLRVREATRAGCPPLPGSSLLVDGRRLDPGCPAFNARVLALARDPAVKLIVLSARWPMYMDARPLMGGYDPPMTLLEGRSGRPTDLAAALDASLGAIERSGTSAQVIVVGPVPELPFSPPDCMAQARRFGLDLAHCETAPNADTLPRAEPAVAAIERAVARHPGVRILIPTATLCTKVACRTTEAGDILYFDADHLSASGARRLTPAWLDAALPGR